MLLNPVLQPVVTRASRLSAAYLPAFCAEPAELAELDVTVTVTVTVGTATNPMVLVGCGWNGACDPRDRIVLVAHATPMRLPVSDGETCDPYLFRLAQPIRAGFLRNVAPPPAYLDSLADPLTRHLERHYAGRTRERERAGLSEIRLARALAYIDAHFAGEVLIEELAEVACLSPFHFSHMFKRSTGLAPHAFLRRRRIVAALGLLAETSLPIAEIARATGHESQAHFSVSFRRVMAMTPSSYRRLARLGAPPAVPS